MIVYATRSHLEAGAATGDALVEIEDRLDLQAAEAWRATLAGAALDPFRLHDGRPAGRRERS